MARSCFFAAAFVLNVLRFLRLPVFGFFFREYSRYFSALSFLIMIPSSIRRQNGLRAFNCTATSRRFKTRRRSGRLQRLGRTVRNPKDDQRSENCEVCRQVTRKAPVLAGVTETAASNVESANFCRDSHEREGKNQRR